MQFQLFGNRGGSGSPRPRRGSPADRGKVVPIAGEGGDRQGAISRIIPGIIAGAADLDPAAVLTATVAGASFGLSLGWVVLLCIPILMSVFGVSARIGHQTRLGLFKIVREHFGQRYAVTLASMVVAVNVLMIIADIMAVSEALSIILNLPPVYFPAFLAFTVWYILTLAGYERVNSTLSLLALFLFAYVGAAALSNHSITHIAKGILLPQLSPGTGYVMAVVALFGSLLTPDVIVWQTSTKREHGATFHEVESKVGCFVAAMVSLCAVIAASTMNVADPTSMTTRQAATALAPLGDLGPILFALGIIGSGMVALPILVASLCFSVAEAADWRYGLSRRPWEARRFFMMICAVLFMAVVVNYLGINTVRTLYWSQVMAGIFIVPILFFILWISNDRRIMRTTNSIWQNFWLGAAVGGMIVANLIFFGLELFT
ncbi:MAG TPA: divalent metal cation transporter [Terriglobales bacterium]|nr:divalent metal cation transporter [Terriglobales bacterium]